MSILQVMKKVAIRVMNRQKNIFSVDVSKQKKYLEKFEIPQNDVDRSYYQYKCQVFLKGKMVSFFQNAMGLVMLMIYYPKYMLNAKKDTGISQRFDAVFLNEDKPKNILPNELQEKYKKIKYNTDCFSILNRDDRIFLKKIFATGRYSPFFKFRCMNDVAEYSAIIAGYNPQTIITCSEYSFTSSVLTLYCNEKKVKHIDVMHGEKLFYIRDSFFRFDQCYVWDMHYCELFRKLKAAENQFVISIPKSLRGLVNKDLVKVFDYSYYLAAEDSSQLESIRDALKKIKDDTGCSICIRPHPRYSNLETINKIFKDFNVEDTKAITIEESIGRTYCVISLYSTVLMQAYYNDVCIVIDDVTSPDMYEKLQGLDYIILNKEHKLLSEVIAGNE